MPRPAPGGNQAGRGVPQVIVAVLGVSGPALPISLDYLIRLPLLVIL